MKRLTLVVLALILIGISVPDAAPAQEKENLPTLDQILDRYIEVMGGWEAYQALETRIAKGKIVTDLPWRKPPYEVVQFEAYSKVPGKSLISYKTPGGIFMEGSDGKIAWKQTDFGIEMKEPDETDKLWFILDPRNVVRVKEHFPGLAVRDKRTLNGRNVYGVLPEGLKPEHYGLFFDVETGMLDFIGYYWELQDYREIDDIKIPFRVVASRKGGSTTYIFDEIVDNTPIEDLRFSVPGPEEIFPEVFDGIDDKGALPVLKRLAVREPHEGITCRDGRFLYDLVVGDNYTKGLELSPEGGYSTVWLALAFGRTGGEIISLQGRSPEYSEVEEYFSGSDNKGVITIESDDPGSTVRSIEGRFDFIFIDAERDGDTDLLPLLKEKLNAGGAIAAYGALVRDESVKAFQEAMEKDDGFETSYYRTSEAGIAVCIKKK